MKLHQASQPHRTATPGFEQETMPGPAVRYNSARQADFIGLANSSATSPSRKAVFHSAATAHKGQFYPNVSGIMANKLKYRSRRGG